MINKVIEQIKQYQFDLSDELELQTQLYETVLEELGFEREFSLNKKSRIDFYHPKYKIGIEVKVKGSAVKIYRQCERYAQTNKIDELILLTAKAMGMPSEIEAACPRFARRGNHVCQCSNTTVVACCLLHATATG